MKREHAIYLELCKGVEHLISLARGCELTQVPPGNLAMAMQALKAKPVLALDDIVYFKAADIIAAGEIVKHHAKEAAETN